MKRYAVGLLLVLVPALHGQAPRIPANATVFIEPMDGYENYLAAALAKKNVPVVLIADRAKATYIMSSTMSHRAGTQPLVVINNGSNDAFEKGAERADAQRAARGATSASISITDAKTLQIVFAYSVGKAGSTNQIQSTAEACAKHLKEFIEKPRR